MDLDFTQLPNQDLTNNSYNSVGGISMQVVTSGNPYFKVVNGEGVSYSNNVTGFGYLNVFYYTTFTGSSVNVADRIRVVAEFSGTRSDAGANSDPNYMTVLFSAGAMQAAMFYRGPWTNQKFNYLSIFTTDSYASRRLGFLTEKFHISLFQYLNLDQCPSIKGQASMGCV